MPRQFTEIIFMGAGDDTKDRARVLVGRLQRGLNILAAIQNPNQKTPESFKEELRHIAEDLTMALTGKEITFADVLKEMKEKEAALELARAEAAKPDVHLQWHIEDVSFCDPVGLTSPTTDDLTKVTCSECIATFDISDEETKKLING